MTRINCVRRKKQRQEEGEEDLRIVRGKIIKNQPRSKPTRPVSGRKLRYKWYEPPSNLIENQDDDVRARHSSFDDDGDGIGGASRWPVD